ncbi:hypothetical protein K490DRAFT_56657 [Saccharata proteae CBS 121410]|uniref:Proteophosphoglycan 5 n=1 Tax=Saccharata proteae CBS 121410 TaxID=1314787 RepID=A0A9P4HW70_9PEZI|nr:hypothetical protein K490DRAFT_56657 [Saccharata proteae CBS 121410]
MSAPLQTPSKSPRAPHKHTKSAATPGVTPNAQEFGTPVKSAQRRQGRNRKQFDQNQANTAGHVSDSNASKPPVNARRLDPDSYSRNYDGAVSDGVQNVVSQKKGRGRQRNGQESPSYGQPASRNNGANNASTPAKDPAYAGPAFHASPAPSALPMPKFFSKSMPADGGIPSLQSRLDQESDSTDKSDKSDKSESPEMPEVAPAQVPPRNEASPLDFFFKADREEKAKKSSLAISTPDGKKPPPIDGRKHERVVSNGFRQDIFPLEMDSAKPMTPKPNSPTPSSSRERLSASRSVTAPTNFPKASQDAQSYPKALQDLFSSSKKLDSQPTPQSETPGTPPPAATDFHTPSPFYRPTPVRSNSGPHTPTPQTDARSPSFYYGNRNLSPLFQAAQSDSTKRSSGLRQEIGSSLESSPSIPSPHNTSGTPRMFNNNTTPSRAPKPDAATISRNYLNQHIQAAGQDPLANLPFVRPNGTPVPRPVSGAAPHENASPTPATNSSMDAKSIENDLKRMLNLQIIDH